MKKKFSYFWIMFHRHAGNNHIYYCFFFFQYLLVEIFRKRRIQRRTTPHQNKTRRKSIVCSNRQFVWNAKRPRIFGYVKYALPFFFSDTLLKKTEVSEISFARQHISNINTFLSFPLHLNSNAFDCWKLPCCLLLFSAEVVILFSLPPPPFGFRKCHFRLLLFISDLSRNRLAKVTNDAFVNLSNLTYLDLSYNKLVKLEPASVVPLKRLHALNISGNIQMDLYDIRETFQVSIRC